MKRRFAPSLLTQVNLWQMSGLIWEEQPEQVEHRIATPMPNVDRMASGGLVMSRIAYVAILYVCAMITNAVFVQNGFQWGWMSINAAIYTYVIAGASGHYAYSPLLLGCVYSGLNLLAVLPLVFMRDRRNSVRWLVLFVATLIPFPSNVPGY